MAFPTTDVLDDFDRANGSPGANWSAPVIAIETVFQISTNEVGFPSGTNSGWWNPTTYGPDSEAFADIPVTGAFSKRIGVRLTDVGDTTTEGYFARFRSDTNTVSVERIDDGTLTLLGATVAFTLADGDSVGVEVVGDEITAYAKVGGTWGTLLSRTDSAHAGAGYLGFWAQGATTRMDNFGGGTVGGEGGPLPLAPPTIHGRGAA